MRILVIGGTGTVGSETVRQLVEESIPVSVLTRSPEKSKSLPAGVKGVVGDLRKPESLRSALSGIDRLFLVTPVSETETEEGLNAIRAAKDAGVKRLVMQSIFDVEKAPHIPHFRSKIEMEKALRQSGIPYTLIMPNSFFQNDYWYQQAIMQFGVYPEPDGDIGVSRVDVRDIAEAAVHALLEEHHEGQRYPLVGPQVLTGKDMAETWSRHLGRPVRYGGNDLEAWAQQAKQLMPAWMVEDVKIMFAFFQKNGLRASAADLTQQNRILHRSPRDYDSFVAETSRKWKSEAA